MTASQEVMLDVFVGAKAMMVTFGTFKIIRLRRYLLMRSAHAETTIDEMTLVQHTQAQSRGSKVSIHQKEAILTKY